MLYRVMTDFEEFAASSVNDLLHTAYLIVWDTREAEDLVQECLFRVARRWSRVRKMRMPLAYARRILINLAIDRRRWLRLRADLAATTAATDAIVDPIAAYDDRAELLSALAALPTRQRAVLVLRYFNDLTEREAAEILGCPPGTVKSSAARGLARLREALQPTTSSTGAECHD